MANRERRVSQHSARFTTIRRVVVVLLVLGAVDVGDAYFRSVAQMNRSRESARERSSAARKPVERAHAQVLPLVEVDHHCRAPSTSVRPRVPDYLARLADSVWARLDFVERCPRCYKRLNRR